MIDERFLEEQRERVESDEQDEFYDVTAWSLPFAQNLDAYTANETVSGNLSVPMGRPAPAFTPGRFGFLIDAKESQMYPAIGALLRNNVKFRVSSTEFTHGDRTFTRGTAVIQRNDNIANLDEVLRRIVLPQAMRVIVPPTGNETIAMLKDTSLLAFVPASDLFFQLQAVGNRTFQIFPMLVAACLWYLAMTSVLMVGQHFLERYFGRGFSGRVRRTKGAPAVPGGSHGV